MNYIVFDTETTNGLDDSLVYDCGWSVINDNGEVLKTRSYVVADIFCDRPELMETAYFSDKIPQYIKDIADKKRKVAWFHNIKKVLYKDCKKYNIIAIIAHNARFDYNSCQTTQRYLTKSKNRWFFPYKIEIWDSLKMARQIFGKDEDYKNFCLTNGFVYGKNNNVRLTAEVLYKYLTNNLEFVESHTGLEDTMIEKEIFLECMRRNPNINKKVWGD